MKNVPEKNGYLPNFFNFTKRGGGTANIGIQSIRSNFGNTSSANSSSYFLGKIAFEKGDFVNSSLHLNDFLNHSDDEILVCGAIKLLAEIQSLL